MIIQTLLTASQQLQIFQCWQVACKAEAATPRHQGDPLYGVQAQMLMGAGPFASPDCQVRFQPEVLQLTQELALKTILAVHDEKAAPAFTGVRQGPTEPYPKFIARQHAAIDVNPEAWGAWDFLSFLINITYDSADGWAEKDFSLLTACGRDRHRALGPRPLPPAKSSSFYRSC